MDLKQRPELSSLGTWIVIVLSQEHAEEDKSREVVALSSLPVGAMGEK